METSCRKSTGKKCASHIHVHSHSNSVCVGGECGRRIFPALLERASSNIGSNDMLCLLL